MKIWYQSATRYRYDPSQDEFGKTLEEQCRRALRPETEVYVTGVPERVEEWRFFKSLMYYHSSQFINNMLRAEKEGYDAFVIGCSFDTGLEPGRELLSIPVIGITQASLHLAAMLGELFAIVTCESHLAERYRQMIRCYGLESKHLQGNYVFPASESELIRAPKEPKPLVKKFKAAAEKAVADGASVIIPVPATIYQLFYRTGGLTNIDGALILDPVAAAMKMAEMLVDLKKVGIEVSRKLGVYGSPGKELLKKASETYAKVFKIDY